MHFSLSSTEISGSFESFKTLQQCKWSLKLKFRTLLFLPSGLYERLSSDKWKCGPLDPFCNWDTYFLNPDLKEIVPCFWSGNYTFPLCVSREKGCVLCSFASPVSHCQRHSRGRADRVDYTPDPWLSGAHKFC